MIYLWIIIEMDKKIVLYSESDLAGSNIARILKGFGIKNIIGLDKDILYIKERDFDINENIGNINDIICIVASRHSSKSGIPTLTCHSPGNFSHISAGGNTRELAYAPAIYLREALKLLKFKREEKGINYEVSYECTHHGPTELRFPIMFVEVGSTEREWSDTNACMIVAEVILDLIENEPENVPTAIAFGGGHYCRKFSAIEEYAIGHICPKYNLENIDSEMIEEMISKTIPRPSIAIAEKKGMGKEKDRIIKLLKETDLELVII